MSVRIDRKLEKGRPMFIGTNNYNWYKDYSRKTDAKKVADKMRKLGYLARVMPFRSRSGKIRYDVYLAKRE